MKQIKWYYHGVMFLFWGKMFDLALIWSNSWEQSQHYWDKAAYHEVNHMENS